MYNFEPKNEIGSVPLKTVKELSVPLMQDWKEENVEVYNPWQSTEKRNIIRCLLGATKSQRKLFKLTERRRLENLEKLGILDSNLTNNFVSFIIYLNLYTFYHKYTSIVLYFYILEI